MQIVTDLPSDISRHETILVHWHCHVVILKLLTMISIFFRLQIIHWHVFFVFLLPQYFLCECTWTLKESLSERSFLNMDSVHVHATDTWNQANHIFGNCCIPTNMAVDIRWWSLAGDLFSRTRTTMRSRSR